MSFSDSANLFSSRITPRALSEIMYPALRASDSALSFVANVSHVIQRTPPAAAQHSSLLSINFASPLPCQRSATDTDTSADDGVSSAHVARLWVSLSKRTCSNATPFSRRAAARNAVASKHGLQLARLQRRATRFLIRNLP